MEKRWNLKQNGNLQAVSNLQQALNVDKIIATLLVQRGILDFDSSKSFFRPDLNELHDPFLMKDMDIAIDRINEAINKGERILVFGDYDVDGTTAVSTVFSFLKQLTDKIDYYIPDRYKE